jgi:GT2 family glycosyltransferase
MTTPLATVAIVPRERFSFAAPSLESILSNTAEAVEMIYVDAGSPAAVSAHLERRAAQRGFRLLRAPDYLTPNRARNWAMANVRTRYVVFIDNDTVVSPGWLEALVDCAESTGAWVVGPVYCEGEPVATRVHMAGGLARIVTRNGRRTFFEQHRDYGQPLHEIAASLRREPVEQIEFHCALVRMEAFDRIGPLDEGLMSAAEHTDLCLLTRDAGATVYLEPSSVVTYVGPLPLEPSDLPYYRLRWSHAWNMASIERFRSKWNLSADDPGMIAMAKWLAGHRRLALEPMRRVLRVLGRRPARLIEKVVIAPLEEASNRARFPGGLDRRRRAAA